ncbi:MAG TPA: cupin domain-containing protein [Chloroflexota bacterium]|nr:cupin domain-containing protein [Chloroflexota bacterium]
MESTQPPAPTRDERIAALNERAHGASLRGAWERSGRAREAERVRPWVWRWEDVKACLLEAGDVVPIDDVMRMRTIALINPTSASAPGMVGMLNATMQHLGPGEFTQSHRHTRTSVYFMIQGSQTSTIAESEEQPMGRGDLLVQPSWTWHGTTNRGADPAIWLTVQDTGIINAFDVEFRDAYPGGNLQPAHKPDGYFRQRLGSYRTNANLQCDGAGFPIKYGWAETRATLQSLADAEEIDPWDGVVLDYRNPVTGGATTYTLGCRVQLIPPGMETKAHRHTGSAVYLVVEGQGSALAGDRIEGEEAIRWSTADCFSIPSWQWHRFKNESARDPLILFSVHDRPLLDAAHLYREESR